MRSSLRRHNIFRSFGEELDAALDLRPLTRKSIKLTESLTSFRRHMLAGFRTATLEPSLLSLKFRCFCLPQWIYTPRFQARVPPIIGLDPRFLRLAFWIPPIANFETGSRLWHSMSSLPIVLCQKFSIRRLSRSLFSTVTLNQ